MGADTKPPALPASLATDADWAAAIRWLQHHKLILHVPLKGQVWFERKEKS
jgi:hypothetical protein